MAAISVRGGAGFQVKAVLAALLLLAGCTTPTPSGAPRGDQRPQPLRIAQGGSATIEVTRLALDPAQGSAVAATDLGPDCASPRPRPFDPNAVLLAPLDSVRAVRGTLQEYGYITIAGGGGQPLFDNPDARAGLQIGAVIAELTLETCGPRPEGVHTQGTGRLRLVLDWQIFSPAQRQVIYATRTVGEAEIRQDTPFLEATLYTAALREATRWLLSDPRFVDIAAPRVRETPVYRGWRETYVYQPPIIVPDYGPYWRRYPIYRPDYLFYDPFFNPPPRVIIVPERAYGGRDYDRRDRRDDRNRRDGARRDAPPPSAPAPSPIPSPTPSPIPPSVQPILGPDGQPIAIEPQPAPAPPPEATPAPPPPNVTPPPPAEPFIPSAPPPSFTPPPDTEATPPREEPRFEPRPREEPRFEPQPREEPRFERFEPAPQPPQTFAPSGGMQGGIPGDVELPACGPELPPGVPCR